MPGGNGYPYGPGLLKVAIAGKGGVGKTTISALPARELASTGAETLAVDCDPNPTLAEELGISSSSLRRFTGDGLRPAEGTLSSRRSQTSSTFRPAFVCSAGRRVALRSRMRLRVGSPEC